MTVHVLIGDNGGAQPPWHGRGPNVRFTDPDNVLFLRGLVLAIGLSAPPWTLMSYFVLR